MSPFGAEMVEFIKKVVALNADLNVEERNLLSVAYKNVIGSRRAAWRILSSIEQKEEGKSNEPRKIGNVKEYRMRIEEEMSKIANEILSLLEDRLVPAATATEPKVFFFKMKVRTTYTSLPVSVLVTAVTECLSKCRPKVLPWLPRALFRG